MRARLRHQQRLPTAGRTSPRTCATSGSRPTAEDVVTSAQAAARLVASGCDQGRRVFVIGGAGLVRRSTSAGSWPVQDAETTRPAAVVSGYAPDLRWRTVIEGAILVPQGRALGGVEHRPDGPHPDGPGPGNGVLVGAVAGFAERRPGRGGQARAAALPRDPAPLSAATTAGRRRPARHRHRGGDPGGLRQPAGDDRGHRAAPSWSRRRRRSRPTYVAADLGRLAAARHGATAGGRAAGCGRLERPGGRRRRPRRQGRTPRHRRLVAGRRRRRLGTPRRRRASPVDDPAAASRR